MEGFEKELELVLLVCEPYEYFCPKCLQLRLKARDDDVCGNCGNANIIKGAIGSLNKEELMEKWNPVQCAKLK